MGPPTSLYSQLSPSGSASCSLQGRKQRGGGVGGGEGEIIMGLGVTVEKEHVAPKGEGIGVWRLKTFLVLKIILL